MMLSTADPWLFVFAGVFFLLCRLAYHCLGFSLFRHPIVAGLPCWLFWGDENLLLAAVFFELFWLDFFHAGTYVPPDSLAAYLLFAPLVMYFDLRGPTRLAPVLLLCLTFSWFGAWVEMRLRRERVIHYHRLNQALDNGHGICKTAGEIARKGLCQSFLWWSCFYGLAALSLWLILRVWARFIGPFYQASWAGWELLLGFAALGGLMALRLPSAWAFFIVCAAALGCI
ncbi:MAG: hypothetical protein LBD82_05570, partial [Deltaproteobacteria bacterium]|nr:hypothetical protein [Deltaproteobacteria bacterium]